MKCIIITIYDPNPNYGNRLQNYAMQSVLASIGASVHTVSFEKKLFSGLTKWKYLLQSLCGYRLPGDAAYWKYHIPKVKAFHQFNNRYIDTIEVSSIQEAEKLEADYFVLGSDQVWNPQWYDNCELKKYMYLLTFTVPEKKVTFAPSFGAKEIPEQWTSWFRENLKHFREISVREEAGVNIIRDLTGKKAEVLIDPTMMLDKSEWLAIAEKPKNLDCSASYILTYFLGGRSGRVNKNLEEYAVKNNMKVYNLLDRNQPALFVTDPGEFIYLISNARLVMTDSFHACVFSFLFKKPFLVYAREGNESSMMSRMETFLKKFDLERKYVDSGLENDLFECEYSTGFAKLNIERQKALSFLKRSMGMQEQTE